MYISEKAAFKNKYYMYISEKAAFKNNNNTLSFIPRALRKNEQKFNGHGHGGDDSYNVRLPCF